MERQPDIVRTIVLVFAVGLMVTGFTSLQASEEDRGVSVRALTGETHIVPVARGDNR